MDVHVRADALKNDAKVAKQKPRFIVVTDFEVFVALDTKTEDSLDIPKQTREAAARAHQFGEIRVSDSKHTITIPRVSSENRPYLPVAILTDGAIIKDRCFGIYDGPIWLMSIIASKMHKVWIETVCVRLELRISYSNTLGWNTFPFPDISDSQKEALEEHVFAVLDERELHPEKTLTDLYDPDKMPEGLAQTHHQMDLAIERCYRKKPFKDDTERLTHLFQLYQKMIVSEAKAVLKS